MSQPKYGQIINCVVTILIVSLFSLCRLAITTQLRSGSVDKMAGIFTKRIWQPCSGVMQQRWPESLFSTQLLFQNFWIRVRKFFKFENPTPVQTPATNDPTEIYPCFYLRNDHANSCFSRNWNVTPDPFFHKFWLRLRKKNAESCRSRLRHSGSMATSVMHRTCGLVVNRTCGLVVRALASCLVGRCSCGSNLGRVVPRP